MRNSRQTEKKKVKTKQEVGSLTKKKFGIEEIEREKKVLNVEVVKILRNKKQNCFGFLFIFMT